MTLHLRIIKAPDGAPPNQTQQTLDERGGSIGRGPANSWVLPDPERILSSRHCEFVCEGGRYQLIDHSTNGTFINGSTEPVGKGTTVPIHDGDEIEVGDYRFAVECGAAEPRSGDSPFAEPYAPEIEAVSAPAMDDPFASDPFDSSASLSLNGAADVMDPLQALDRAGSASQPPDSDSSPWGFESALDANLNGAPSFPEADPWSDTPPSSALMDSGPAGDAIAWPESHPENLIPDDWLEDEPVVNHSPAFQKPMPGRQPQSSPARVPDAAVQSYAAAPDSRTSADASLGIEDAAPIGADSLGTEPFGTEPFGDEPPRAEPPPVPPQRPRPGARSPSAASQPDMAHPQKAESQKNEPPRAQPHRTQSHRTQPQRPQPEGPAGSQGSTSRRPNSVNGDALIEAMGLDASRLSEAERAELYPLAGRLVREVVSGLMQVLRSRASIKNEFRMNVTTIQPVENNPLKFSADVDEALENIFVRRSPAYKPPLDAVHEGFQEIAEHQLAMIAGMRSAFEHMLQEFNPEHLEPRFKKQQKPSPIPALQQRRYWLQFQEYYQDLNDNIERSFQQVFGDEFVQAYQDQLRRLSASRSS